MKKKQVIALMKSSATEAEWNANCEKVKTACGGYPNFWYAAIMLSGIARDSQTRWSPEQNSHPRGTRR